ncbi:MAG: InlB B-repeat-containing protein, partial [Clostridiales bacterium]|nr:InlB B-repeat-containing protein [Clostridiales bacterium]
MAGRCDEPQFGLHLVGYRFVGWTEDDDLKEDSKVFQEGAEFEIDDSDVILYSVWEPDKDDEGEANEYLVTYDLNGGEGDTPTDQGPFPNFTHFPPAVDDGSFAKEGCKFLGWSTDEEATTPDKTHPDGRLAVEDGDMALYAVWGSTYANLYAAVQGETNAAAAYQAFAAKALADGYPIIAKLFFATADAEAKHADDEWAILAGMG